MVSLFSSADMGVNAKKASSVFLDSYWYVQTCIWLAYTIISLFPLGGSTEDKNENVGLLFKGLQMRR